MTSDIANASASANAKANVDSAAAAHTYEDRLLPGYWVFDGAKRAFLLDENCTGYFGLENHGEWIDERVILERLAIRSIERFYRVMDTRDWGSIIFEDIKVTLGPHAGKNFVINGSVLSRFADGKVKQATGYITSTSNTFSEFIAHEISGDGFFSWDAATNHLRFSESYCFLLGYDEHEFPHNMEELTMIVHPDDREIMDIEHHIVESPAYGDSFEFCVRLRHKKGYYIWSIGRGIIVKRDSDGRAIRLIGTLSDINLVQDNFENIKQLLYTDTLTGLKNRAYFQHHLEQWQEESMQPISVIYADVTGLKITNDVLGHADGDILLLTVTEVLSSVITRPCDIMRLAGDEFLVIMMRCDEEESKAIIRDLNAYVEQHNEIPEVMPVFVGFGRATIGEVQRDSLHACIERADVRMQQAKEEQRESNYAELKKYLEKRKGRPVSMRDGRRLEYMSTEDRKKMHDRHADPSSSGGNAVC